jgi:hypothetical protein
MPKRKREDLNLGTNDDGEGRALKIRKNRLAAKTEQGKVLDLATIAENYLFKQLVRTKRIRESPAL